ncbi:hypothetical protein AURDEDRAFT_169353 [Auricularia subglabra TFB-10046 SS5]|nr:hypothetical protein AURDEDRAFT_169353 [Auricularia subglabra TFB-10046 SS5]
MAYGSIAHALHMGWDGNDPKTLPVQDSLPDDNLLSLATHARACLDIDAAAWLLPFRTMISEFRFALTAQRIANMSSIPVHAVLEEQSQKLQVALDMLKDYHRNGVRWAYLLLAGSHRILPSDSI